MREPLQQHLVRGHKQQLLHALQRAYPRCVVLNLQSVCDVSNPTIMFIALHFGAHCVPFVCEPPHVCGDVDKGTCRAPHMRQHANSSGFSARSLTPLHAFGDIVHDEALPLRSFSRPSVSARHCTTSVCCTQAQRNRSTASMARENMKVFCVLSPTIPGSCCHPAT